MRPTQDYPDTTDIQGLRIATKPDGSYWYVRDWCRLELDGPGSREEDWQTAITIFEDCILGRFLSQVEALRAVPDCVTRTSAGFAIMAIDCLLVETLEQFRKGVPETPDGKARCYFRDFLTNTAFGDHFDEDLADKFRDHVRNGILHQAETKHTSRIWVRSGAPLVQYTPDGEGLEINRDLFHDMLVEVFKSYLQDLRKDNPVDQVLRSKFKTKMDHICRVDRQTYVE